jgi:hypothetical protein
VEAVMALFELLPRFCLDGQRRITENLNQDNHFSDQDSNLAPPDNSKMYYSCETAGQTTIS